MMYTRELQDAREAARRAADLVLKAYETFVPIPDAPASISTEVDRASQEVILQYLHAQYPEDGLVAEEATPTVNLAPRGSRRTWVVDPIDGTRGFAMKNGEFSVMVGLTFDQVAVVGVVIEPVIGRVTYASAGGGCWVELAGQAPVRCQVTAESSLAAARLVQSHGKPGKPPKAPVAAIAPGKIVETYSAGIKLAMVARGEVEMYVNDYVGFHDWDICAGHVLVTEAGGQVSLFDGSPVVYGGQTGRTGMIASNAVLFPAIVERLATLNPHRAS